MKAWLGQPVRRGTLMVVVLVALLLVGGAVALALTAGRDVVREQVVYEAIEHDPSRTSDAIRPELRPRFAELEQRISRAKGFSDAELAELEEELGVRSNDVLRAIEDDPGQVARLVEDALDPSPQQVQQDLDALCRSLRASPGADAPTVTC